MAGDNDRQLLFADGELIERLMRGDPAPAQAQPQRPVNPGALTAAVALASADRLDDAAHEVESAAKRGEDTVDVQTELGRLRFEQQQWNEAEAHYAKAAQLQPEHATTHYNLGLCRELGYRKPSITAGQAIIKVA